jgi:hypothetical protein
MLIIIAILLFLILVAIVNKAAVGPIIKLIFLLAAWLVSFCIILVICWIYGVLYIAMLYGVISTIAFTAYGADD